LVFSASRDKELRVTYRTCENTTNKSSCMAGRANIAVVKHGVAGGAYGTGRFCFGLGEHCPDCCPLIVIQLAIGAKANRFESAIKSAAVG
jgi:hypothetical protein